MTEQLAIQNQLRDYFIQAKQRNSSFSLRAFSKKLQISPSSLSEILQGKRRVSSNLAHKLLLQLSLDPREIHRIMNLFEARKFGARNDELSDANYLTLSSDQFQLISQWHHFAILSLAETSDFVANPLWIAKRLKIKLQESEKALERLQRLGLIEWNRKLKKIKLKHIQISTTEDIADRSIQVSHIEDLKLSERAISEFGVESRDFSALTIAIDPKNLPQAKKLIREFQDKLSAFLESGTKKEVYKFCFHGFPLSHSLKGESHE